MTRLRTRRSLWAALLALALSVPAHASDGAGWTNLDRRIRPPGQSAAAMAYDEARHELVLFPGYDAAGKPAGTWIRRGAVWQKVSLDVQPEPRYGGAMAFDAARGEIVLFGGYGSNPDGGPSLALADTWTWDGSRWHREEPASSPNPRALGSIAYDRVREEVVLFGGVGVNDAGTPYSELGDTWTWNGETWTRRTTPVAPTARNGAGMAFDEARGETVLFGGSGQGSANQCLARPAGICVDVDGNGGDTGDRNDTWVWDGAAWTQRPTLDAPDPRSNMGMGYDPIRRRVVLFSGVNVGGLFHDTWTWDGAGWTDVTPASQPEARFSPVMAFDRRLGELVLYGGHRITYLAADTWGWDGATWRSLEIATPMPRIAAAMAHDPFRGLPMLFGGDADQTFSDQWVYEGGDWRREHPATRPPARSYAAVTTDSARKEIVLFGGLSGEYRDLGDVWVWNGSSWRNATPPLPGLSPLPRQSSAMAYDAARGEVVLFGGWYSDQDLMLADTWTWDGAAWELKVPTTAPPALKNHVMTYDAARGEVVLYGGITEAGEVAADTWTWDGGDWTKEAPTTAPPPAAAPAIVYDPSAQRVVMFSGLGNQQADTWAWDGTNWTKLPFAGPSRRSFSAMTYVPELAGSLLFGGLSQGYRDDTWLLRTA